MTQPKFERTEKPLAELMPYINNSRTHSANQVEQVAASIEEFGFTNPVICDEDGTIIAGHCRVLAARKLKHKTAPVIIVSGWSDAQKKAYVIADNKLALNAGWNDELLRIEMGALQEMGFNLELTGFELGEIAGLNEPEIAEDADEDEVPKTPRKPVTREGDVWKLGNHRLMVGDATDAATVEILMNGRKADLVWTDPPYNVDIQGTAGNILNDNMSDGAFAEFLAAVYANYFLFMKEGACIYVAHADSEFMKEGACIYVAHADSERVNFTHQFVQAGFKLSQILIWVKQSPVLSRQDYNWKHEPILYGWKEGRGHYFAGDFTKTTVVDDDIDLDAMKKDELLKLAKEMKEALLTTVVRVDRPRKSELHPTMKPIELVRGQIEASSREGKLVMDLFGGSGATLIAAHTCGRDCYTMELDPKYADVIIQRFEDFTGLKAEHEDGQTFQELKESRT